MADDSEIIDAVLQGETERYGELVTRYQEPAWRLAYGFVRNAEEARDLSQNGFFKAYQNLRRFRRGAKFSTWFYRIVANECKDFFRRSRGPEMVPLGSEADSDDPIPLEVADPTQDPRRAASDRELAAKLVRSMERLPVKQRTAFLLHHLNGLPLAEVAEVMGCRVGTIKAHLFRAGETLRLFLEPILKPEAPR